MCVGYLIEMTYVVNKMNLALFFQQHPKAAIAFSGGVDSAYLLYAAIKCGADVKAYYVKTAFQPQFELDDAMRLAKELQADMAILRLDVLSGNLPAEKLYLGLGFYRVSGARMFYPDTGWTEFDLYEFDLREA